MFLIANALCQQIYQKLFMSHLIVYMNFSAANPKNLNMVKKLSLAMLTQVRLFIFTYLSYRLWFLYLRSQSIKKYSDIPGVWPKSEVFNDNGIGGLPKRWEGGCESREDFNSCNEKLIRAKYLTNGFHPFLEHSVCTLHIFLSFFERYLFQVPSPSKRFL